MSEQKYLISIAIGPVQDFIASARRSRDLWFGSWILSELSKAAAKAIGSKNLIFPNATDDDLTPNSNFNVVNKILAEVSLEKDKVAVFGEKIEKAVRDRLDKIRIETFKRIPSKYFLDKIAKSQIDDLIEFVWVALLMTNDYVKDREKVEQLLSARKATRDFNPVSWGDNVPKSSLDGQRESVLLEELYTAVQDGKISKGKLRVDYGAKEGERLCGVGLLKRHGKVVIDDKKQSDDYPDRFFSTSHVASLPLLQRLTDKDAVRKYIEKLSALLTEIETKELYKILGRVPDNLKHDVFGVYDGHLLFEERLSEFFTSKNEGEKASKKSDLQEAKEALLGIPEKNGQAPVKGFLENAFGKNLKPLPYYALILADGDFMGKTIDNIHTVAEKNNTHPKDEHKNLSAKLSEFAGEVRKIIEREKQGSLIYSGGDDVLAFVGLHKVLEYSNLLQQEFHKSLENFKYDDKNSPTLSVGIAVVHHLEPLEDALELVRKAEKTAKTVDGKNALAVVVDKRSGTSRIAKGRWGTLDERLKTFIKWHKENAIPDGAAYELRDLAYQLEIPKNAEKELGDNLAEAKQKEAIRILKRKKGDFGARDIDQEIVEFITRFLKEIAETKKDDEDSLAILADELIIARIFADAENMAEGK